MDKILYGHDNTSNIVNISSKRGKIYVYREFADGVKLEIQDYSPWVLADTAYDNSWQELEGNNEFKYIKQFSSEKGWREFKRENRTRGIWAPRDLVSEYLLTSGRTYFKGMQRKDVSVLSWDIETSGLKTDDSARVYLIANTFSKGDTIIRKLFDLSDYKHQGEMLEDWCSWVREMNPAIMLGHNSTSYDWPYVMHVAAKSGTKLRLGRDGSEAQLSIMESKYRVDGTRNITYRQPIIFGREIIDTMFLMMSVDVGKKHQSYSLKTLIKEIGKEQENRTMVDASKIYDYWNKRYSNPEGWKRVCEYSRFDGDDALALWDHCGDLVFYPAQQIPFTFERVAMSASGSQINAQLVRAYLSQGHSIPKASEKRAFEGALSYGFPGVYKNVFSLDYASLYPSVIIQFSVYDKKKDPKAYVLHMVKEYRKQRLEYKRLAESGDSYYKALDATAKRQLNSFFGFYAAKSSNYNSLECAELITTKGRDMLNILIQWGTGKDFYQHYQEHTGETWNDSKSKS